MHAPDDTFLKVADSANRRIFRGRLARCVEALSFLGDRFT
jgi:hypothetical protein